VRKTTFKAGKNNKFTAMKVPRQCPLVVMVMVGCTEDRAFGVRSYSDEKFAS
jgi:hypothetical protein